MTKVILRLFAIIFFLDLSFVGYFSLIGFETKSFNNQIKENLKKVNSKLDVKINDVKIILDLFNLKINKNTLSIYLCIYTTSLGEYNAKLEKNSSFRF